MSVKAAAVKSFLALIVITVSAHAVTEDQIRRHFFQAGNMPKFAFTAQISTKMIAANRVMRDSGEIIFKPPHKLKVSLRGAKLEVIQNGDTSWVKAPNGNVTRSIGKNGALSGLVPGMGGGVPGLGQNFGNAGFKILEAKDGKYVEVELTGPLPIPNATVRMTLDTVSWRMVKTVMAGPQIKEVTVGYGYQVVDGYPFIVNTSMTMANGANMVTELRDIRKTAALSENIFKGF